MNKDFVRVLMKKGKDESDIDFITRNTILTLHDVSLLEKLEPEYLEEYRRQN